MWPRNSRASDLRHTPFGASRRDLSEKNIDNCFWVGTILETLIFHDFIIFQVKKMATWPLWPQFWVPLIFFRNTYHVSYLRKKRWQLSRNIYFSALEFVFFFNFTNIDVYHIFICWLIREYSMTVKIFSSKSMISGLSNALSNASIALLVLEKFTFEVVKLTQ